MADMFAADGDDHKSNDAHNQARTVAAQLKAHFADSDYTRRAAALVYKLDQGVPVYGNDRD
jgi:gluconate kinase